VNDIQEKVRAFVLNDLQFAGSPDQLTEDFPLIGNDVLDSLGIFQLVSYLERQFGIEVEDAELVPDNFGSIGRIAELVERKRAAV
jgi:acyl carrier protein